jgi:hypothetical protein
MQRSLAGTFATQERTHARDRYVTVRNLTTGVIWTTGRQAPAPALPLPRAYSVLVTAVPANQPPARFLDNPAHRFEVQGVYLADGQLFVSGVLTFNTGLSDPPAVYAFSLLGRGGGG